MIRRIRIATLCAFLLAAALPLAAQPSLDSAGWVRIGENQSGHAPVQLEFRGDEENAANLTRRLTVYAPAGENTLAQDKQWDWYILEVYHDSEIISYNGGKGHICGWWTNRASATVALDDKQNTQLYAFAPSTTVGDRSKANTLGLDFGVGMSGPKAGAAYSTTVTYTNPDVEYSIQGNVATGEVRISASLQGCDGASAPVGRLFADASASARGTYQDWFLVQMRAKKGHKLVFYTNSDLGTTEVEYRKKYTKDVVSSTHTTAWTIEGDMRWECTQDQCGAFKR